MTRILITDPYPTPQPAQGALVITPHRAAATALNTPYYSLPRLARLELRKKGLDVVSPLRGRHMLRQAAAKITAGSDISSIVASLGHILETSLRTGIDIDSLIERASPRVSMLARIIREYRSALLAKGYIDQAELLWWAANSRPEPRLLYIYGHFRARKEEIFFINAIAGEGSEYVLPIQPDDDAFAVNREWAEWLRARKWSIRRDAAGSHDSSLGEGQHLASTFAGGLNFGKTPTAVKYPTIEAESRGVLAQAKQAIIAGTPAGRIAIVCRDPELYAPVIASVADEFGVPVRILHKVSLATTMFGGYVRSVLDAFASGLGYEATARMLMHPFGPGLGPGGWTQARGRRPADREEWTLIGAPFSGLDLPDEQTFAAWASTLRSLAGTTDVRLRAAIHTREMLAFNSFVEALAQTEAFYGERSLALMDFSAAVGEILDETNVPFRSNAAGIELHEPNTILGASYDHVFVVGLAESVFPAAISENPVLDFFERKALAPYGIDFEEAAEVARWETLSFYFTLLAGSSSVSFSYPEMVDNSERIASPFFDRLGLKPRSPESAPLLVSSTEEVRSALLPHEGLIDDAIAVNAREQLRIEMLREGPSPHDEYDGVIGVRLDPASRRWSASQLTTLGQCGFRWFCQRVLRLDPVSEADLGMDFGKRGIFYHKVLELAVTRAMNEPDIRAATLAHLDQAFADAEADPEVQLPMRSNWGLQRAEHLRTLRKAVESPDFIAEGASVLGLEKNFNVEWKGLRITGKIDRVDATPDGLIAIDYKAGAGIPKGAKDAQGKLTIDVQIPLYSNVALRQLFPDSPLGSSVYYSLVKGKKLRAAKPDDLERLEGLVDDLKKAMENGSYAVAPDIDEDACTYCDFDAVCRKGPRLERKEVAE